jgi:hypothetical protein
MTRLEALILMIGHGGKRNALNLVKQLREYEKGCPNCGWKRERNLEPRITVRELREKLQIMRDNGVNEEVIKAIGQGLV